MIIVITGVAFIVLIITYHIGFMRGFYNGVNESIKIIEKKYNKKGRPEEK